MPNEKTHADSLRLYHTGAASPNAAQTDPDASLGGWPSASEIASLQASIASPISGVTVDHIGGLAGSGTAYLNAPAVGELQYKAPGSSAYGAAVAIANGETKLLEDGDDTSKAIRVSRTSADDLTGTATLTLATVLNNAIGLDNVTSAESASGDTEYRCVAVVGENVDEVASVKAYIAPLTGAITTDTANLSGSGAGSLTTTGSYAAWALSGHAAIFTSGGSLREVVYYSSRTDTALTVPTVGRGRLGTSATAGADDDTVKQVPPISLAAEAAHTISAATFTGAGLNDLATGGTLTTWIPRRYRVEIDAAAHPDTFKWSNDNGSTWEASTVAITSATQTLENGIEIVLSATSGHTLGDRWDFTAAKAGVIATESATPSGVSFSTPYAVADGIALDDLATGEVAYVWIKRDVVAGSVARTSAETLVRLQFDAT